MNKEIHIDFRGEDRSFVNSFGGEIWDGDFEWSEYGIQIGNVSIGGLTPETTKRLAIILINHLILNGHNFDIVKTGEQDQVEKIVERK